MLEYVIMINLLGFALMGMDKRKAKRQQWRISEKTLLTVSIIGGSVGSIVGMRAFRHKTKKAKFSMGLPLILMMQILIIWLTL